MFLVLWGECGIFNVHDHSLRLKLWCHVQKEYASLTNYVISSLGTFIFPA